MTVAEVPDCFDVNECLAECHPITDKWGACYVDDKEGVARAERCMCAPMPEGNMDFIDTLLAGVGFNFACFSVRRRTPWACASEDDSNPSCRTTQLVPQDGSPFYDGACVFEGARDWASALIYEEP